MAESLRLSDNQYHLAMVKTQCCSESGKVTVGLARCWSCVTDYVVYALTGSKAYMRKMSTMSMPTCGHDPLLPFI